MTKMWLTNKNFRQKTKTKSKTKIADKIKIARRLDLFFRGRNCSPVIGRKRGRHLIGYREFFVEKNAFVNPATSGESQKSTYKYRRHVNLSLTVCI